MNKFLIKFNISFFFNNKPNNVRGEYNDFKIKRWRC